MSIINLTLEIKRKFFKVGSQRTIKYKKNTFLIISYQFFNIISSFLLVSVTLNFLGIDEYGVWLTLTSLVTWFSFLDIGLAHGLRNKFAEARSLNQVEKVKELVSTAFFSLSVISSIFFIILFSIGYFADWAKLLNVPNSMAVEVRIVGLMLIFTFCFRLVINIVNVLKTADQEPAISNLLILSGNLLTLAITFVSIKVLNPTFLDLGLILCFSQLIPLLFANIFYFLTDYKEFIPDIKNFSIDSFKEIFNIGFKFFLIQLSNLIILQSNILILAHYTSPEAVAEYNIAYKYLWVLMTIYVSIITPMWSASTEAYANRDFVWLSSAMKRLNILWFLIVGFGVLLFGFSGVFYSIWLGDTMEVDYSLLGMMLVYFLLTMKYSMYRMFMNGIGKIKLQFVISMLQASIHIPLAVFLTTQFDVYGVLWVLILWAGINCIWEPLQYNRFFENSLVSSKNI